MIYAYLLIRDEYDCNFERRLLSETKEAIEDYKEAVIENGNRIIDESIEHIGTLVVLPEDTKI